MTQTLMESHEMVWAGEGGSGDRSDNKIKIMCSTLPLTFAYQKKTQTMIREFGVLICASMLRYGYQASIEE